MTETLGSRLKIEREKAELSQANFAESIGISREMVGKYERDIAQPGSEVLIIMHALGFDVMYILTGISGQLTEAELKIVESHRADIKAKKDKEAFIDKALEVAHKFRKWSKESGEKLTFSTFVNSFNYQDSDANKMHSALVKIFDAVEEA
jgi:transcriptional regulator with XRE-family HTH domain